MEYLHLLSGPVIGAIIGYCTNHIAVKMMFKPLEPVYIFGRQLPFTPGIIPKNKKRIGRALGRAVSQSLLTEEDLSAAFLKPEIKDKVVNLIYDKLNSDDLRDVTPQELACEYLGKERTTKAKAKISSVLTDNVSNALAGFDLESVLHSIGVDALLSKVQNSLLAMFINEDTINSLAGPIAESIRIYFRGRGRETIGEIAENEIERLFDRKIGDILQPDGNGQAGGAELKSLLGDIYEKAVEKVIPTVLAEINIAGIVEKKIDDMDIGFLEDLLLSIIKTELDYVIRLGALIGFVIGCVNILI